ncbi:hypothetical protein [Gramella sp. AN32]|uniref:Uncharacterized protein n=1 Tax=Christiangramia antarctica TaxID=2058158 RepID=A0ABW5X945_9FLAO|nr:hypothetical protein [Gramella sp. AN32]MCM4157268.1 hypothetical protein [Gramella sp. AN32]
MNQPIPLIEGLKKHKAPIHKNDFIELPADTPFGNLNLNWVEMLLRMDYLNDLIIRIFEDFEEIDKHRKITPVGNSNQLYEQKINTEQIFYWIRKTTDELISLMWLLNYKKLNNKYPKKLKISSIGEYLNKSSFEIEEIEKFKILLQNINEISNGFKHSFVNSQIHNYQGAETPIVIALSLNYNDLKKTPKFHTLELREVLKEYNSFVIEVKDYIRNNLI